MCTVTVVHATISHIALKSILLYKYFEKKITVLLMADTTKMTTAMKFMHCTRICNEIYSGNATVILSVVIVYLNI